MNPDLHKREIFHLTFLRHLVRRIRPGSYALKGGVNLRLFFQSIRYSEDMDLDIKGVPLETLKKIVMNILTSQELRSSLRTFQIDDIVPPDLAKAKQTEAVQRFKVHLKTAAGEDLFTKIECSRRTWDPRVAVDAVAPEILARYRQPPLLVAHYPIDVAILQKAKALGGRAATEPRDVFDLFFLHTQCDAKDLGRILKSLSASERNSARTACSEIDYEHYRDAVCSYLADEERAHYETKAMWSFIQSRVVELLI